MFDPSSGIPADYDFEVLREAVRSFSPYVVFTLMRTWANAWTTSSRMHEQVVLGCFFGCPGAKDELAHYLCCTRFWRALKTALGSTSTGVPAVLISSPLLDKLAIAPTSQANVLHICALSHSYHTLKHHYRQRLFQLARHNDYAEVARLTVDVVKSAVIRFRAMM